MDNQAHTRTSSESRQTETTTKPIMHSFTESKSPSPIKVIAILVIVTLLGVGTGFAIAKFSEKTGTNIPILPKSDSAVKGQTYGSGDTSTFKDIAEGVLEEGGIEGEGQYHLVRTGGESQNVYLTSSLIDLSQFVGKKIKVWGETQTAQKAGWLMDVGKVEVL